MLANRAKLAPVVPIPPFGKPDALLRVQPEAFSRPGAVGCRVSGLHAAVDQRGFADPFAVRSRKAFQKAFLARSGSSDRDLARSDHGAGHVPAR